MAHWLSGNGCVPINHLMEDAATAEISRAQVWQWVHHPKGILNNGQKVTMDLVRRIMEEEMSGIRKSVGPEQYELIRYTSAQRLYEEIIANPTFEEFLTLRAYAHLD